MKHVPGKFGRVAGLWLTVLAMIGATPCMAEDEAGPVRAIATMSTSVAVERVREIIATLDDANRSGNYSVLRELASPAFQEKFGVDELARHYAPLRDNKADLRIVRHLAPQFDDMSSIESDGSMRLAGRFRGGQRDVRFDMSFVQIEDAWRLDRLEVAAPEPERIYVKSVPAAMSAMPPAPAGAVMGAALNAKVATPGTVVSVPTPPPASTPARVTVKRVVPPVTARVINGEIQARVRIETRPMNQIVAGPSPAEVPAKVSSAAPEADDATSNRTDDLVRNDWGVGLGPSVKATGRAQ